jgi:thiamine kinase-like enzyme
VAAQSDQDRVRALPIWHGRIEITPLSAGVASRTYLVRDGARQLVARCGRDVKLHGVVRSNEQAASLAAAAAGISPAVRHAGPGLLVIDYIEGRSLTLDGVRANRDRCVELVRRVHHELGQLLPVPAPVFDVFAVIGGYLRALSLRRCRHRDALPGLVAASEALRAAIGPATSVFGHNDLLAGNFIDDGSRLWLIDWDYAGLNAPLFDLGGLSANNGFTPDDDAAMLRGYFGARADAALHRRFAAAACAARLREALWSLVSEGGRDRGFDYAGYADANLEGFQLAYGDFAGICA